MCTVAKPPVVKVTTGENDSWSTRIQPECRRSTTPRSFAAVVERVGLSTDAYKDISNLDRLAALLFRQTDGCGLRYTQLLAVRQSK